MPSNFFDKLAPWLAGIGASLTALDDNTTGPDDLVGELLIYGAGVALSVNTGAELPPLPEIVSAGIAGKISGAARSSIVLASGVLMVAEFQLAATHPRQSKAFHYIGQVLAALVAGRTVPAAPSFN